MVPGIRLHAPCKTATKKSQNATAHILTAAGPKPRPPPPARRPQRRACGRTVQAPRIRKLRHRAGPDECHDQLGDGSTRKARLRLARKCSAGGGQQGVATGGGGVWADGSLVWACSRRAATPARRSPPRRSWPKARLGFSLGCIPLAAGTGHLRRMRHWMRHQPGPCGVIMGAPVGLSRASAGFRVAPACAGRPPPPLKT